ncbi:hypothetical protein CC80DRAFT_499309 [Byssothecium circinans]|uniref:Uncharacterized protein n=1 Tax=Byssothecium circinans TaxID=147558 RepID=A0A6A5UDL3_9PLEO|nr:hypothetical protein CC80DRAFT_499309 [Byssothecium circinans]
MSAASWIHISPSALTPPEYRFSVIHRYVEPDHINETVHAHTQHVGTYTSLIAAQLATFEAGKKEVVKKEQDGIVIFLHQIDLNRRGLIYKVMEGGIMLQNQFEIHRVDVREGSRAPLMDGVENASFLHPEQGDKPKVVVNLPSKAAYVQSSVDYHFGPPHPQECDPHWAQSRIPYFRKRDEGPFRRPDDRLYQEHFEFIRKLPESEGRTIPQIVSPQPDNLNRVPDRKENTHQQQKSSLNPATNSGFAEADVQTGANGHVSNGNAHKQVPLKGVKDVRCELGELDYFNVNGALRNGLVVDGSGYEKYYGLDLST